MTEDMQKVKDLLLLRKCSNRTISNYLSCINRFKNYYKGKDLKNFNDFKKELIQMNDEKGFNKTVINWLITIYLTPSEFPLFTRLFAN